MQALTMTLRALILLHSIQHHLQTTVYSPVIQLKPNRRISSDFPQPSCCPALIPALSCCSTGYSGGTEIIFNSGEFSDGGPAAARDGSSMARHTACSSAGRSFATVLGTRHWFAFL